MSLSREDSFLLTCLRSFFDRDLLPELQKELDPNLDWELLFDRARSHSVQFMLYWALVKANLLERVPAATLKLLKDGYHTNIVGNTLRFHELGKVVRAFGETELSLMVLKGGALAPLYYQDVGLRPMCDIDLLVQKEQLGRVDRQLLEMGYKMNVDTRDRIFEADGTPRKRYVDEISFEFPSYFKKGSLLDVHWQFGGRAGGAKEGEISENRVSYIQVDIEDFWNRAHKAEIEGFRTQVPSSEDFLIHLGIHGYASGYPFKGLCDIALLIRDQEENIDWSYLLRHSKEYRIQGIMFFSFHLVQLVLGVEVPGKVMKTLKPSLFSLPGDEELLLGVLNIVPRRARWKAVFSQLQTTTITSPFRKLIYLRRRLFPPPNYIRKRFPQMEGKGALRCYLFFITNVIKRVRKNKEC